MKATVTDTGEGTVLLSVSLNAGDIEEQVKKTRAMLSRGVEVEGFRKGNVPDHVAARHLDAAAVRREAMQLAMEERFSEAAREHKWDVAKTGEPKVTADVPGEFSFEVPVYLWPSLALGDVARFKIERREATADPAKVAEALETLRTMRASFVTKDGPAVLGDRVEADFGATLQGVAVPGGEGKNHPLVLGGRTFMPGFEEQLVGMKGGERKEFNLTAPADYAFPQIAGKTLHFTVAVNAVQSVNKPELTDEFAKSLRFENVDALKEAARTSVLTTERTKERDRVRLAILDAVLAEVPAPAPEFLVTEELDRMIARFEDDLAAKGMGLDLYLARLNQTRDDMRKQWSGEAARQVKMSLVIRQVTHDRSLTADDAEVDRILRETMQRYAGQPELERIAADSESLRNEIAERVATEAAMAYLEETCAVNAA